MAVEPHDPEVQVVPAAPLPPDVADLLARHRAWASGHSTPEDVHALTAEQLRDPALTYVVARAGDRLLGVGALRHLSSGEAEIKGMHTVEQARGRGVGRGVLAALVAAASARGYGAVSLETGSGDAFAPARALYVGAGFAPCGPFGDHTPSPSRVFLRLELDAGPAA